MSAPVKDSLFDGSAIGGLVAAEFSEITDREVDFFGDHWVPHCLG